MKKLIFLILLLLAFFTCLKLHAEAPDTLWTKMFLASGGMMEGDAIASFTKQTADGGFIACGYAVDPFLTAFILKTDASGKKLWQKQYYENPVVDGTMTITSAAETMDGGYILLGHGLKPDHGDGLFLFRVNSSGDTLWSNYYDHSNDTIIVASEIKAAPDGGFIIIGSVSPKILPTQMDMFFMKTGSNGNVQWFKTYGTEEFAEIGLSVEPAFDGGYVITGSTDEETPNAVVFLKIDEHANIQFGRRYINYPDIVFPTEHNKIIKTQDGMYMIAGTEGGNYNLVKIKTDGTIMMMRNFGEDDVEQANDVCESDDGGFVLAGYAFNEWPEYSGQALNFPMVVKFNSDGEFLWDIVFYHDTEGEFYSINQNADKGYIVGGLLKDAEARNYLYLVRLEGDYEPVNEDNIVQSSLGIAPNPVNSQGTINYIVKNPGIVSLKLINNLGVEVMTLLDSYALAGAHYVNLDGIGLESGTYYCRYQEGNNIEIKKLIIIR